jgi:PAS domain S-box-containing protein
MNEHHGAADERASAAAERDSAADERASAAAERGSAADERLSAADERASAAAERGSAADESQRGAAVRGSAADERESAADERESAAEQRESAAEQRESAAEQRESAAEQRDIVAAERDSTAQQRELDYARALLASAPDAMVIINADGIIQLANAETERLFGYRREDLIGGCVEMLLPVRYRGSHPDERAGFFAAPQARAMGETLDLWGRRQDGSEFAVEIRLSAFETEEGLLSAAAIRDVSERREAEQFRQAVMDNMADGLYVADSEGRLTYMNAAAARMLGFSEEELQGKSVHEAVHYQHADGSAFPAEECEFVRVRVEGRPVRKVEDVFTRKDGTIFPTAYSAAPLGAGANGHGMVVVFRDITEERAQQTRAQRELNTLTWVGRIRDALDGDRLVLYAQAIVPLSTRAKHSEELLVRMLGQKREIIPPARFLPVGEKYGQIGEIDHWVISQTARLAASGRRVHANLSADSIGRLDLVDRIEQELSEAGADPTDVVFEITETALMGDIKAGEAFTRRIADIGCAVALDDFGTGYGSFTYLQKLHIAYIKIDITFVRDLVSNPTNQHLVKAIVNIAHGLGQQTIAEGVENSETLEVLREYGIDHAQGFHLGRPEPLESGPRRAGDLRREHEREVVD